MVTCTTWLLLLGWHVMTSDIGGNKLVLFAGEVAETLTDPTPCLPAPYLCPVPHSMDSIFAHELLPLWFLTAFFLITTFISFIRASMRAARVSSAVASLGSKTPHSATTASSMPPLLPHSPTSPHAAEQLHSTPSNIYDRRNQFDPDSLVVQDSLPSSTVGAASPKGAHGRGRASRLGPGAFDGEEVDPSDVKLMRDEAAAAEQERRELYGTTSTGRTARVRAWVKEFVQRDGGLLFDAVIAVLLLAVSSFWTAIVVQDLSLFEARGSYRVYDAAPTASANWLLPARPLLPDLSTYSSSNTTAAAAVATADGGDLRAAATALGLDMPTAPGDPGRWLLPAQDAGEWEALNGVLTEARRLVDLWVAYGMVQAVVIIVLILRCGRRWGWCGCGPKAAANVAGRGWCGCLSAAENLGVADRGR